MAQATSFSLLQQRESDATWVPRTPMEHPPWESFGPSEQTRHEGEEDETVIPTEEGSCHLSTVHLTKKQI